MTTLTAGQMTALAEKAGFNKNDAKIMGAIGMAESPGDPNAHNTNAKTGDNSYGLWQINMLGSMGPSRRKSFGISNNEELFNPSVNAKAAYKIYKSQGLGAWSTYKTGAYKDYLNGATADNTADSSTTEQAGWTDSIPGVSEVADVAEAVIKAGSWISTPSNWVRVLYVMGGGVIIVAGIAYLAKDTAIQSVAGSAIKSLKTGTKSIKKVKKVA